jgi:hypothetical protein
VEQQVKIGPADFGELVRMVRLLAREHAVRGNKAESDGGFKETLLRLSSDYAEVVRDLMEKVPEEDRRQPIIDELANVLRDALARFSEQKLFPKDERSGNPKAAPAERPEVW